MRDPAEVLAVENGLPGHVVAMYDFWRREHRNDAVPHIRSIDPVRMPVSALPWLGILQPLNDAEDFLIRLSATGVVEAIKADLTNMRVSELRNAEEPTERLRWSVRTGRPYMSRDPLTWVTGRNFIQYRVLVLPFSADDGAIARLMMVFSFDFSSEGRF